MPVKSTSMAKASATRTTAKRKAADDADQSSKSTLKKRRQEGPLPTKIVDNDEDDAGFAFSRISSKPKKPAAIPTRSSPRNHAKVAPPSIANRTPRTSKLPIDSPEDSRTNGSDSFVALPVSDTPIIRRNQQFRQTGGDSRRRSSLSSLAKRGKRASSMPSGLQPIPHPDIPSSQFYKLIDEDLPEPVRMKRLLVWCARRSIDATRAQPSLHSNKESHEQIQAANIAKTIEEEVLQDLVEGKITTSWYHRPDEPISTLQRKPHPQNVKNAAKMQELEQRIAAMKTEEASWQNLLQQERSRTGESAKQPSTQDGIEAGSMPERFAKNMDTNVDLDLLPAHEAEFMHSLTTNSGTQTNIWHQHDEWLRTAESNLEFHVDTLLQALHQQNQYLKQADTKSTSLLESAAKAMAAAESRENQESQARGIGTIDILRQISRLS